MPARPSSTAGSDCSLMGQLFFSWMGPVLTLGSTRQLDHKDMLTLDEELQPKACSKSLASAVHVVLSRPGGQASFARCLLVLFWKPMLVTGLTRLVNDALAFGGPLLVKQLVDWLYSPSAPWPNWDPEPARNAAPPAPAVIWMHRFWVLIKAMCPGGPLYGVGLALTLGAVTLIRAALGGQFNWRLARLQAQLRAGLQVVLYDKSLAIAHHITPGPTQPTAADRSKPDKTQATTEQAMVADVNSLVGVDIGQLLNLPNSIHELWSLPLQMIVALVLLYMQVRYAFVAGLLVAVALIPINRLISNKIVAATKVMLSSKDVRLGLTVELVSGLRPIKMLGWETLMMSKIQAARQSEMKALAIRKYLDAGCVYLWASTSLLFTCLTFGLVAVLHLELTPGAAATSFALFQVLIMPLNAIPWVIIGVLQAFVSIRRIQAYLQQPEHIKCRECHDSSTATTTHNKPGGTATMPPTSRAHQRPHVRSTSAVAGTDCTSPPAGCLAVFDHAWFAWPSSHSSHPPAEHLTPVPSVNCHTSQQQHFTGCCLSDMSLSIPEGKLTVITGKVGAGKSSLLYALLGELAPVAGAAHVPGIHGAATPIAYAPQSPWLFSGSLRDNILMGATLDMGRYLQVLDAAALLPDLAAMAGRQASDRCDIGVTSGADLRWLGDRGAMLSGGQRARVSLARALYSDARVVLLDDILAALDPDSAAHVTAALLGPAGTVGPGAAAVRLTTASQQPQCSPSPDAGAVHNVGLVASSGVGCRPLGRLLSGRSVVVVTQSYRWLAAADNVIELAEGRVVYQGDAQGYLARHAHHLPTIPPTNSSLHIQGSVTGTSVQQQDVAASAGTSRRAGHAGQQDAVFSDEQEQPQDAVCSHVQEQQQDVAGRVPQHTSQGGTVHGVEVSGQGQGGAGEEERAEGHVSAAVWWGYIKSVGVVTSLVVIVSLIAMQAAKNGADIWVADWVASLSDNTNKTAAADTSLVLDHQWSSSQVASLQSSSTPLHGAARNMPRAYHVHQVVSRNLWSDLWQRTTGFTRGWSALGTSGTPERRFLNGLIIIAGLSTAFTLIRSLSFAYAGLTAARRNHDALLTAITTAPITYLEALPAGRILNRFTSDVSKIDESLPFILNIFLDQSIKLAGLVVVVLLASPPLLVLLLPMGIAYRQLSTFYRASSRELRRLDATALSPVFQGVAESKDAAACVAIRAYNAWPHFKAKHMMHVTSYQRAAITGSAASVWLSMRLQLLATFLVTSLGLLTSISHIITPRGPTPASPDDVTQTSHLKPCVCCSSATLSHVYAEQQWFSLMYAACSCLGSRVAAYVTRIVSQPAGLSGQASLAGLCLAYTLPVVGLLEGLVGSGAETEAEMVAVERCVHMCSTPVQQDVLLRHDRTPTQRTATVRYSGVCTTRRQVVSDSGDGGGDGLRQPLLRTSEHCCEVVVSGDVDGVAVVDQEQAVVEFNQVVVRYPGRPHPALSGCSFTVQQGEWVGVVGRNGAGKSTVLAALLRLIEVESGSITVAGHDIRSIPLRQLRSMFGVMPQSPFLVSGTIRDNVDPHHRHTWRTIISALQAVHLLHVLAPAAHAAHAGRVPGSQMHRCSQPLWQTLDIAAGLAVLGLRVQGSFSGGNRQDTSGGDDDGVGGDDDSGGVGADQAQVDARSHGGTHGETVPAAEALGEVVVDGVRQEQGRLPVGHDQGMNHAQVAQPVSQAAQAPVAVVPVGMVGLSSGQQQLLCLCRLLLSGKHVVLLDEATASVDPATALIMQQVLRQWLAGDLALQGTGCSGGSRAQQTPVTVLEVSHQLAHVMGHSRVLVMQDGQVVQSGPPSALLAQSGLPFASLVRRGH